MPQPRKVLFDTFRHGLNSSTDVFSSMHCLLNFFKRKFYKRDIPPYAMPIKLPWLKFANQVILLLALPIKFPWLKFYQPRMGRHSPLFIAY